MIVPLQPLQIVRPQAMLMVSISGSFPIPMFARSLYHPVPILTDMVVEVISWVWYIRQHRVHKNIEATRAVALILRCDNTKVVVVESSGGFIDAITSIGCSSGFELGTGSMGFEWLRKPCFIVRRFR
ncbi:hypothetical protein ACJRO7_034961 [Eucalyptus globulus]|uniref:Uncharacterized protein n=1 Tax=Eucalyptus globulus TaxID=34317 RepID=A0ABD3J512_EUCGL